jgi:hypothetical protein
MNIQSPEDLAKALKDRLKLNLTARPWNIHRPTDTFWWLVPSTELLPYRYGKLAFSLSKDVPRKDLLGMNDPAIESDKIFAGFNLEKGYGQVVANVLKRKPQQIATPEWLWFEIVGDTGAARFSRTLAGASQKATLYLYVVASVAYDRESDVRPDHDVVMFTCEGEALKTVAHTFPIHVLDGAETATDFVALARRLRTIDGFHWVDVYVGTHVAKGDIDLQSLHKHTLSYFDAWLR